MEAQITLIITDDRPQYRRALRKDLEEFNISTIGEAGNGIELLQLLKTLSPDIILLDLEMPDMNGSTTMNYLMAGYPHIKVIILSNHDEATLMQDFMRRGAKGYISKEAISGNITLFAASLRKVREGREFLYHDREKKPIEFSMRQREIIPLLSAGKSTAEIAGELRISESGVIKQKKKIMEKMGVPDIVSFYKYVFKSGLDQLSRPGDHKSS